jgi:hypothetical protein
MKNGSCHVFSMLQSQVPDLDALGTCKLQGFAQTVGEQKQNG